MMSGEVGGAVFERRHFWLYPGDAWSKELLTIFEVFEISLDLFRELVMQGRRKNSEEAVDCFVGEPQAPASPFGLSGLSG